MDKSRLFEDGDRSALYAPRQVSIERFPKPLRTTRPYREPYPFPNSYCVGDVCTLLAKGDPELQRRLGQWCIVVEVGTWCYQVHTWDTVLQVKSENLRLLSYSERQRQERYRLRERLYRLSRGSLSESIGIFLESLGKIERPFLSSIEEQFLEILESSP